MRHSYIWFTISREVKNMIPFRIIFWSEQSHISFNWKRLSYWKRIALRWKVLQWFIFFCVSSVFAQSISSDELVCFFYATLVIVAFPGNLHDSRDVRRKAFSLHDRRVLIFGEFVFPLISKWVYVLSENCSTAPCDCVWTVLFSWRFGFLLRLSHQRCYKFRYISITALEMKRDIIWII